MIEIHEVGRLLQKKEKLRDDQPLYSITNGLEQLLQAQWETTEKLLNLYPVEASSNSHLKPKIPIGMTASHSKIKRWGPSEWSQKKLLSH
jgi:hypothetical protein